MKGYLVLHFSTIDPQGFLKYKETAGSILKRYIAEGKAKLIINTTMASNLVEKGLIPYDTLQVIEFASPNIANEFYNLPEYQKAIPYRTSSTEGWTAILNGFNSSE